MTFRRKLFVVTLTFGGGICCFQPIMRARMEARLSEILGGQVAIGSSSVSLLDGTIALSDVSIRPLDRRTPNEDDNKTDSPIKIGQAALKFNWNSAFYRNFKVDSFLATDVHWEIAKPNGESIPSATEASDVGFLTSENTSDSLNARVESIVQPIKLKLSEESAKQSQTQQKISLQLKSIAQRLTDILPTDGSLNVLRHRFIVDDAKKEIALVRQSIAEDGLARKKADKAINALKLSAHEQLVSKASLEPEQDRIRTKQSALDIARLAIAKEWNANRPIVLAAVSSLTSLYDPKLVALEIADSKSEKGNDTRTASVVNLPVGMTHCSAGRINGSLQFPLATNLPRDSSFTLQFWNLSSRTFLNAPRPTVTLRLKSDPTAQDTTAWMVCTAQRTALPQSDTSQIQLTLEKRDPRLGVSSTKIQHANQGWAATISMPTQCCLELPNTKPIATEISASNDGSHIIGKLIGTTPAMESHKNDLFIEIDATSITELETILHSWHETNSEKKRLLASRRGVELLNSELLSMNTHWEQLGDEHIRAHESWKTRMSELEEQLKTLTSVFQRTSRATNTLVN